MKNMICILLTLSIMGTLCACGSAGASSYTGDTDMIVIKTTPVTEPETTAKETKPEQTQPETTIPVEETAVAETVHQHGYTQEVVEATCTEDGYTTYTCTCGDSYQGDQVKAKGHEYRNKTVKPTESKQGYTKHTCSHCGHSYKDNYTDPIPHETEVAAPQETSLPVETAPESTMPAQSIPAATEPVETVPVTEVPTETAPVSAEIKASEVEAAILKYINQFRGSPLTRLSGMSKVAKKRAKQLVYNFNHDTADIKAAHAAYQYGEYIDMTVLGLPESENYYSSNSKEAIAYRGQSVFVENADQMGREIAEQFRASSGHWAYLGDSKYTYCGIGATFSGDKWYVCIMVNGQNYG